jgi:hypothetical protein
VQPCFVCGQPSVAYLQPTHRNLNLIAVAPSPSFDKPICQHHMDASREELLDEIAHLRHMQPNTTGQRENEE